MLACPGHSAYTSQSAVWELHVIHTPHQWSGLERALTIELGFQPGCLFGRSPVKVGYGVVMDTLQVGFCSLQYRVDTQKGVSARIPVWVSNAEGITETTKFNPVL